MDNIGVFDRSKSLPFDGELEQADGTAWVAFFCILMLDIALGKIIQSLLFELFHSMVCN